MKIAAYLIVKNEEDMLLGALDSVRECDEVVVCDTGSTDSTVALARAWDGGRARVGHFTWCDDFSKARNAALDMVTAEWCLIIDADERVTPGTVAALRAAIAKGEPELTTLRFLCRPSGSMDTVHHFMVRAHRRARGLRWRGRIHEALNADSGVIAEGCELIYGHSPAHALDPDRTIRILEAQLEEMPGDPRALYYLGREWWYRQNWERALDCFTQRCRVVGHKPELADAWLYLSRCRWNLSDPEGARTACLNALAVNANFREALHWMAALSFPENAAAWRRYAGAATNEGVLFVRI